MIGLASEVGGNVIVLVLLEGAIAEIAPENGGHAEFMRMGEGLADFDDLARALIGAEIDRGADSGRAHVPGFLDGPKENLIKAVRVGEQLVVVHLDDERNLVGIFARDGAKNAKGGSHGVAAALDGELDDIRGVKIIGILREAGAGGMLDALVDGKNGEIAGAAETAVMEHALEIGEDAAVAVGERPNAIDKIRTGKLQPLLRDFWRFESEVKFRFCAKIGFDFSRACDGSHRSLLSYSRIARVSMPPAAVSTSQSNVPFTG